MAGPKQLNIDGVTINRRIADTVARYGDRPALSSKIGKEWQTLTFREFEEQVQDFSLGLRSLGIDRGDRVAILSENRIEWAIADLAVLAAGAVVVPIYATLPSGQIAHIVADSGAKAIVCSDAKQLTKVEAVRDRCKDLQSVVVMDPALAAGDIRSFDHLLGLGGEYQPEDTFETRRSSVRPQDLASLVYTSGTTGEPKGAMLSHQNFAAAVGMAEAWFPVFPGDTFLSFLPLCHVFERVTHYLSLSIGCHTYYSEGIFKIADNLTEVRPTIMQSVPRLYETMHERVAETLTKAPEHQKKVAEWALSVGKSFADRRNSGKMIGPLLAVQWAAADKLVLSKIRQRLGGNVRFFVSGGAPLAPTTADFFNAIDIPILEGYGLTETTAPLTCNPYHLARVGTVGKPFGAVKLKIASDGEILAKGPNVMSGYWNNPGATLDMFDEEGWLLTGDIGILDRDGFLAITDRKKDIIVLANGKNVSPQPIEILLKQSPFIEEIVLLGDKSGTIGALVYPAMERLAAWAKETKLELDATKQLIQSLDARKKIKSEIDRLSLHLAEFEKVRKIALLAEPLTIESGELTPTLKVRRKIVFERHGKLLE